MKLTRIFYVRSRHSDVIHLAKSPDDGARTLCGMKMQEWLWARTPKAKGAAERAAHWCKRCNKGNKQYGGQKAMPDSSL